MSIASRPGFDLRHLRAFVILTEELHFGRAAQRLGVSQPALTQSIRAMETALGTPLVERTTRRVTTTPAGLAFAHDAIEILSRVSLAIDKAQREGGVEAKSLRVGAIFPTMYDLLPRVLAHLKNRHRDVGVQLETWESPRLVAAVEAGTLDVAILRPPRDSGALEIVTLALEDFVLAVPSSHALASVEHLALADLASHQLLRIARADIRDGFDEVDRQLLVAGIDLRAARTVSTTLNAVSLVAAGEGLAIVPGWTRVLPWKGVTFRRIDDLRAALELSVAWRADNRSTLVEYFVRAARHCIGAP